MCRIQIISSDINSKSHEFPKNPFRRAKGRMWLKKIIIKYSKVLLQSGGYFFIFQYTVSTFVSN